MTFDPLRPCVLFSAPPARRERRRTNELLFVAQGDARFVVKSFAEADDAPVDSERRMKRELAGIAAFRDVGAESLAPVAGPFESLALELDGKRRVVPWALVFPFVERPTLYDAIASSSDPTPLLVEAAARIRARHHVADSLDAVHSDGSAHNVFADFTWFDFSDERTASELRDCKAIEVLRFTSSVVEVSPPRTSRPRVAAFCRSYDDRDVLSLALDYARMDEPHMRVRAWTRMLGRPDKLIAFWRGESRHFRRVRTWDALDRALR